MVRRQRALVTRILIAGIVATALVVGASFALRMGSDETEMAAEDESVVPPITAPSGPAAPVPADRITVGATTVLAAEGDVTYGPANTLDDDLSTAWNSDAGDSSGRGQILTYRFNEPVDLAAIRFTNGYAKSAELFTQNHRVQQLWVRTDGGDQMVNLLDTSTEQEITIDFGYTSKVVLEVVEVYEGVGFENPELTPDLALSEIDFLAVQR